MRRFNLTYLFLIFAIFACCKENSKTNDKRKLTIPRNLTLYKPFQNYLMDSTEIARSKIKIYSSINFSCATCVNQIDDWQSIGQNRSLEKIPMILIGHSDDKFRVINYVCENKLIKNFPYPFFLDSAGVFEKAILSNKAVVTDQNNTILFEAEPLKSPQERNEFIEKLTQLNK
ncbi:MAG: hypothetical protein H7069_14530 [Phormidesmis sp. FL-bin-119]|nr:hypothetical protein [Pedobacter sp.]